MGILSPIYFVARTFNTAANLYLVGQVGWWAYKNVREMQKDKLQASKLRTQFVTEYIKQYGVQPSEAEIGVALRSYNAVEKPLEHRIRKIVGCDK